MEALDKRAEALIAEQLMEWDTAREHYAQLTQVQVKSIRFPGFRFDVQFNRARIRSTSAPVDAHAIRERPCFLCRENRPSQQRAIPFGDYDILVNPFPIFPDHLTIAAREHIPQFIAGRVSELLDFTRRLDGFAVFYNGPEGGASAPDHLHFQAVCRGVLPVEYEAERWPEKSLLREKDGIRIFGMEHFLRKALVVDGRDEKEVANAAGQIMEAFASLQPELSEPRVNIVAWYTQRGYRLVLFPRQGHRPRQFYAEGEGRILFSPGAVDFAGVIVTVREADYRRMNRDLLTDLFLQLTLNDESWKELKERIRACSGRNRA